MMKVVVRTSVLAALLTLMGPAALWAQQNLAQVSGVVTDAFDGLPLEGATVVLTELNGPTLVDGATTDASGRYQLFRVRPGRYRLVARFVGYEERQFIVTLDPGRAYTVDAPLEQGSVDLNTIVVSASRQQEKILDAAAAVSILGDLEIQADVTPSASAALRLMPGVDLAQTGIDQRELALRGFNNSSTGETYVMTDNRLSAVPGLALNAFGLMPIATIDMARIEVVRGPGSVLYGSGVDQGLVHFVTKDPFAYPGTTFSVGGGERALVDVEVRQAGIINERMGYKVVGEYARGNDWEFDLDDPEDVDQTRGEFLPRDPEYWKYNLSGALHYRLDNQSRLIGNVGFLSQKMALLTGIGAAQTDAFSYVYGQVRLESGPLFAQIYLNRNYGGDSFYYGRSTPEGAPLPIVDRTLFTSGQVQYDISLLDGREQLLVGLDYKLTLPQTAETFHGRNEGDDSIREAGAYLQSVTRINEYLTLTAALRADQNNLDDALLFSPRVGLVYKPSLLHTFWGSASRAVASPVLNPNFLDFRVSDEDIADPFVLAYQGLGAFEGFTFDGYRTDRMAAFLLPDIGDRNNPQSSGSFGAPVSVDAVPLYTVYGAFAADLTEALESGANIALLGSSLTEGQRATLATLVGQLATFVGPSQTTQGVLGIPDNSLQGYRVVEGPVDVEPLRQTVTESLELGYKGALSNHILFSLDGYYTRKKNFIGPLLIESPLVYLADLETDLQAALAPHIRELTLARPDLEALLVNLSLDAEGMAGLLAQLAAQGIDLSRGGYNQNPVAVVQPDQDLLPEDTSGTAVGGLLSFRNYGDVSLWGFDTEVQFLLTDRLTLYTSASFVSENYFDAEELGEENEDLFVSLNAPQIKAMVGFAYDFSFGLSVRAAGRYTSGFEVYSGSLAGEIKDYFVLDAGIGYDFGRNVPGLRFDMTGQNLVSVVDGEFKDVHREFVGAPRIGRLVMARLIYTF